MERRPGSLLPELNFRLEELSTLRYKVETETVNGYVNYKINLDVYVDVIRVDDIWAQSANINVIGTSHRHRQTVGTGDAEITILNASPAFLILNRLTIPETEGGRIKFNGAAVRGTTLAEINADINRVNLLKQAPLPA